ncbi:NAD(P)H-binding protein [Roseivirga sp. E12]|uniref:NAD(P)H-binding protein n=1 Tax=Roseivirga sp. E12 TaxID=2819237 RepID=UPI001ABD39BC|nr:NAD(P)H-binding protein [Roseivirga sp. E12]MBO3700026.1 NAD(P)H-binding protein [Roseivirga sp. E12]
MESKTAIIAGASGLIGKSLTQLLLNSKDYGQVIALVRKPLGIQHDKLKELTVNFDHLAEMEEFPQADDIFCTLGTTIKNAGSQDAFYKVDFTYPMELAKRALRSGASRFFLVSAMGAKLNSRNFYSRVKGELEDKISFLNYRTIYIFKPSLLRGDRKENRPGEKFAQAITRIVPFIGPWKKYRPIHADKVADAMMKVAQQEDKGCYFYQSEIMQKM